MTFDFSSSASVMLILKSLRSHAELAPSVRNEIRDLIFSYTNGKGDEAVKEAIESRLFSAGITPESINGSSVSIQESPAMPKEVPKAGFSIGRMAPSFSPSSISPTPVISASIPKPNLKEVEALNVVNTPKSTASVNISGVTASPARIEKIVPIIPTDSVLKTHDIVKHSAVENVPQKAQKQELESVIAKAVLPEEDKLAASNSIDTAILLERIRVIKADINTRAGNPVNLVSMNNAIGREYMAALLEAMKQLGGGNEGTITNAMKRLEIAYEQALSVIEMAGAPKVSGSNQLVPSGQAPTEVPSNQNASLAQTPTQKPQAQATPVAVSTEKKFVSVAPVPTSPVQSVSATAVPEKRQAIPIIESPTSVQSATPKQTENTHSSNPPLGATRFVARPTQANTETSISQIVSAPKPISPIPPQHQTYYVTEKPVATTVPMTASPADIMQAAEAPSSVPIHSSKFQSAKSVAMATPLRRVEELPTSAEVKNRSENGNPLYAQEISEGLEQLLSEWSIFHKSGVFGTGPKGSNHPLYKKLAPLMIPLIIAGRFEGATEEVRQSITDYMNGWRYEQGIVYEKEETFENYLRRVIRHIIDVQKK